MYFEVRETQSGLGTSRTGYPVALGTSRTGHPVGDWSWCIPSSEDYQQEKHTEYSSHSIVAVQW